MVKKKKGEPQKKSLLDKKTAELGLSAYRGFMNEG